MERKLKKAVSYERDLEKAAELLAKAKYAIALTGAGVSVESGIRPYCGPDGVWTERGEPPADGYQRFLADPRGEWEKWLKKEGFPPGFLDSLLNANPNPGALRAGGTGKDFIIIRLVLLH